MKIKFFLTAAVISGIYFSYSIGLNSYIVKANELNARGIILSKENKIPESDINFKKSISYKFREHIPLTNLGINAIQKGDFSLAHDYFEKAQNVKRDFLPAKYNDGIAFFEWGKMEFDSEKCNLERVMIFWKQSQRIFSEIANEESFFDLSKDSLILKSKENFEMVSLHIDKLKNGCKPPRDPNQSKEKNPNEEDKAAQTDKKKTGDTQKEGQADEKKNQVANQSQKSQSLQNENKSSNNQNDQQSKFSDIQNKNQTQSQDKNQTSEKSLDNKNLENPKSGFSLNKFKNWIQKTLDSFKEEKNKTAETEKKRTTSGSNNNENETRKPEQENLSKNSKSELSNKQANEKDKSQNFRNSDKDHQQGKELNTPHENNAKYQNHTNRPTQSEHNQDKNSKSPEYKENSSSEISKTPNTDDEAPNQKNPYPHHSEEENQKNVYTSESITEHLEHEYRQKKLTKEEVTGLKKELERIQNLGYKQKYYRTRLEKSEKVKTTAETRKLLENALW